MIKKFTKNSGITLIAMIITIIVMLVLAGVSMNAIVGDNGILNNAINATTATSIAVLQEYLQELYVENYDDAIVSSAANKVEALSKLSSYTNYFYDPSRDGDNDGETTYGAVSYVVDSEGHALYLIKKSGLPEDIQKQLIGGDAGDGNYVDYQSLNDVYGVTSNLEVYYCSSGLNTIAGITSNDLDNDDIYRTVTISSSLANVLGTDTTVTARSLRNIKTLTINSNSGLTSLNELYNLTSLREITLNNVSISLDGIRNCTQLNYLCFYNYSTDTVTNYSELSKSKQLEYLYLQNSCDAQVNSVFQSMQGIDYSKLTYLGIYDGSSNVTDISILSKLSSTTKSAVKYLYLYNNSLTSISALSDFVNVYQLDVYKNSLTSLSGIGNMTQLYYLYAYKCCLGTDETYDTSDTDNYGKNSSTDSLVDLANLTSLRYLDLRNNSIRWIEYISELSLNTLYLSGNNNFVNSSVVKIKDVYLAATSKNIDESYSSLFNTSTRLDYKDQDLADTSDEIVALENNTTVQELRLDGNSDLTDTTLQNLLKTCTSITTLSLIGLTNLESIDFVAYMPNLKELDLRDTTVTDLSLLENNSKMITLVLNYSEVDLTKIQTTISRLGASSNSATFLNSSSGCNYEKGLLIYNNDLLKKLSNCTKITNLRIIDRYQFWSCSDTIDLTACTSLTYVDLDNYSFKAKAPDSLTTIGRFNVKSSYAWEFSENSNLEYLSSYGISKDTDLANWLSNLSCCSKLKTLHLNGSSITSLSAFNQLKSLESLTLNGWGTTNTGLTSLDGLENLSSLKTLNFNYCSNLSDLSAILTLTNLETLKLYKCNVSSLYYLKNLYNLETLDLRNNIIYSDLLSYTDSNGTVEEYYNLQILADLNTNGALVSLYLSGNCIIDYSLISNLTWTDKDF